MKPIVQLNLLGGFQVSVYGELQVVPTKKGQALLAYLAVHPAGVHSRDKLASLLWAESGEEHARHSLRQTLLALRKLLPPEIFQAESEHVSLVKARIDTDVVAFNRLVAAGGIDSLRDAATLYRGEFLEGLVVGDEPIEEWLQSEKARLLDAAVGALGKICAEEIKAGLADWAIRTAHRLLSLDPSQEVVHRTLMRLYMEQGRREAALRQYQLCRDALRGDFDIEPDSETNRLYELILSNDRSLTSAGAQALKGSAGPVLILVVEDELVTRTLLDEILRAAGYEIVLAEDGADALLELGRRKFALVLLDVNIPTLDGLKLFEIMIQKGIETPAMFVTALTDEDLRSRGFEMGAVDFIRKPIVRENLLARVRCVLEGEKLAHNSREHA